MASTMIRATKRAAGAAHGLASSPRPLLTKCLHTSPAENVGAAKHFRFAGDVSKVNLLGTKAAPQPGEYLMPHQVYTEAEVHSVVVTEQGQASVSDKIAFGVMRLLRTAFDTATGYGTPAHLTKAKYLNRMIVLESVAGIPGMVGGMARHLRSLRTMKRDGGWVHSLLEEAENERMHLLTFLEMSKPGPLTRATVLFAQGVTFNAFFFAYLLSPSTCHRFVGYLEEEAVKTYTGCLAHVDAKDGDLGEWVTAPAPDIAVRYWRLPAGATVRDLLLAVRADEAIHRDVNHTLAGLSPDAPNPFA